jgi:IS30 family transposase
MNAKEIDGVFHCDCGFSWARGKNGNHNCADGLREKVRQLAAENVGLSCVF